MDESVFDFSSNIPQVNNTNQESITGGYISLNNLKAIMGLPVNDIVVYSSNSTCDNKEKCVGSNTGYTCINYKKCKDSPTIIGDSIGIG